MLERLIPLAGLLVLAGAAGLYAWIFGRYQRTVRALCRTKASLIGELPDGTFGRVTGTARPVDLPLIAPLTGRACVWYRVSVSGDKNICESRAVPFILEDASGCAIVDPSAAELAIFWDHCTRSGRWRDASATQEAFLARHGKKSCGWLSNKSLHYHEAIISVGETIHVAGTLDRELDPEGPFRTARPMVVRLSGAPKSPLLIGSLGLVSSPGHFARVSRPSR